MFYAELFCQSNFSFLTGASHPEELIVQANFLGYHSLAITDECSLSGIVRAHSAIKQHQLSVKQIVGSFLNSIQNVSLSCSAPTAKPTLNYVESSPTLVDVVKKANINCHSGMSCL